MARRVPKKKSIFQGSSDFTEMFMLRRNNLFKHTKEYCASADAEAAVFILTENEAYTFGHPSLEEVVGPYIVDHPCTFRKLQASGVAVLRSDEAADSTVTEWDRRLSEAMATEPPDWNVATKDLGLEELRQLARAAREILTRVTYHARRLEP